MSLYHRVTLQGWTLHYNYTQVINVTLPRMVTLPGMDTALQLYTSN